MSHSILLSLFAFLLSYFFKMDGALFLSLQSFLSSFFLENDGDDVVATRDLPGHLIYAIDTLMV